MMNILRNCVLSLHAAAHMVMQTFEPKKLQKCTKTKNAVWQKMPIYAIFILHLAFCAGFSCWAFSNQRKETFPEYTCLVIIWFNYIYYADFSDPNSSFKYDYASPEYL